jgi:hypothetical protein
MQTAWKNEYERRGLVGIYQSMLNAEAPMEDCFVMDCFLAAMQIAVYFEATDGGKEWSLTTGQPVMGKHFIFHLLMDPTGEFLEFVAGPISAFIELSDDASISGVLANIDDLRGDWVGRKPMDPDNHLMKESFIREHIVHCENKKARAKLVDRTVNIFLEPAHENMFDGFLLPSPPGNQDLDAFKATGLCTPLNTSDWGAFLLQSACRNGDAGLAHRGFEMLDPVKDQKAINAGIQLASDYYHGDLALVLRQRLSGSLERATLENVSANPVHPDASPSRAIRL